MVLTVLANRKIERYLTTCAENKKFCYGVIVGQKSSLNKDYIIHLARTLESPEIYISEKTPSATDKQFEENLNNFSGQNIVNHSMSVTKMIPGSFYILGIFAITEKSIFEDEDTVNKFKNVIKSINRVLNLNGFFCGHSPNQENDSKLMLNYVWTTNSIESKSLNGIDSNSTVVDLKFLDKPTVWHMFESSYELDEIFPMNEYKKRFDFEKSFNECLEYVSSYIQNSEIFVQNENVEETHSLESYIKDKLSKKESVESFKTSVLQSPPESVICPPKVKEFQGTIRYIGTIYSRVWVHSKSSFKDIHSFIRNDIVRSLAARIQIFSDGFTNTSPPNDIIVVNIPPKRVFFDIPDSGGIQFSEYIFRGEDARTVVEQAKEILDLEIKEENVAMGFEILPNYEETIEIYTQPSVVKDESGGKIESKKMFYYGGIAIALIVLVLSILLHYIKR